MSRLVVTPYSALSEMLESHQPSHLVSLLSPQHMIATPDGFPSERHLKLGLNDVADPAAGCDPPDRAHVDRLLAFSRAWDARQPMVIHCWAGISRSTAAAYIAASVLNPELDEVHLARRLRASSPSFQNGTSIEKS